VATVTLRDLERYMGAVGAKIPGPFGEPWRTGKRPYGDSALSTAAACLKGFYGLIRDVQDALRRLRRDRTRVTFRGVAARAGVSRTFLYENPEARRLVQDAIATATRNAVSPSSSRTARLRRPGGNAHSTPKTLSQPRLGKILQQRQRIADLLGQIRDLEQTWSQDSLQRLTTENTSLKQRIRQLTDDNHTLDERLRQRDPTRASSTNALLTSKLNSSNARSEGCSAHAQPAGERVLYSSGAARSANSGTEVQDKVSPRCRATMSAKCSVADP
jgi:hypothetical protein